MVKSSWPPATCGTHDNQIDTTTGTVKLRVDFSNEEDNLFPNQFVNVTLQIDQAREAVVIPTAAVQWGAPGTFVYLIEADNAVTVRPVTLGPASGGRVVVMSGLSVGDRVVIDGADKLRNGSKVVLRAPANEAPMGAPAPRFAEPSGTDRQEMAHRIGRVSDHGMAIARDDNACR